MIQQTERASISLRVGQFTDKNEPPLCQFRIRSHDLKKRDYTFYLFIFPSSSFSLSPSLNFQ